MSLIYLLIIKSVEPFIKSLLVQSNAKHFTSLPDTLLKFIRHNLRIKVGRGSVNLESH